MLFAFDNINDFISMGHHGAYVWSAWFITLFSLIGWIMYHRRQRQQFYRQLEQDYRRKQAQHTQSSDFS